jgi:DNA polymerase
MLNIAETLTWFDEMGVDVTLEDTPQNQLAPKTKTPPILSAKQEPETRAAPPIASREIANDIPPAPVTPKKPMVSSFVPAVEASAPVVTNPVAAIASAREASDKAKTLEDLRKAVEAFDGCTIKKSANNTVFSDGVATASVMLIGEAPGANEDLEGIPFCGASGQLLDEMLKHIGLLRKENFYITNTLFWRPPGNRRPTPEEIAMCKPFVEKHIALIKPKLIILVGATAITSVLNSKTGISQVRGKYYDYTNIYLDEPIKTTAIFHPSYLLRSPGQKRIVWKDLLEIEAFLKEHMENFVENKTA